jgi:molybdopterin synthase catalytic subunit
MTILVQAETFDPHALLARFAHPSAGALASFVGIVRGDGVMALELEHYPGFTEREIARVEAAALARFDLIDVLIVHRHGKLLPGEAIVLVAALSRHRAAAFDAVRFLMDYLKTDAPFWKREITADGARWIEPREDDRAARAGWEQNP